MDRLRETNAGDKDRHKKIMKEIGRYTERQRQEKGRERNRGQREIGRTQRDQDRRYGETKRDIDRGDIERY